MILDYDDNYLELRQTLIHSKNSTEFLQNYFEFRKKYSESLSLRSFSSDLGFENPSLISEVLKGKKRPSRRLINQICKNKLFHHTESRYLNNLFNIELDIAPEQSTKENTLISELWDTKSYRENSMSSLALLVSAFLSQHSYGMTEDEINQKIGLLVSKDEVKQAISRLIEKEIIEKDGDKFKVLKDKNWYFNCTALDLADIHSVIRRAAEFENKTTQFHSLSFFATKEDYYKVRELITETAEKIAVIAQKNYSEKDTLEERKLCNLYTSFFSIEEDSDWKPSSK